MRVEMFRKFGPRWWCCVQDGFRGKGWSVLMINISKRYMGAGLFLSKLLVFQDKFPDDAFV